VLRSGLPQLPALPLLLGFAKPIIGFLFLPVLILSLQRRMPRPERTAPWLALAWGMLTVGALVLAEAQPTPAAMQSLTFKDVPQAATRVTRPIVQLLLLGGFAWAIGSLFIHRRTRAYLSSAAAEQR
jgi:hypothetical protein